MRKEIRLHEIQAVSYTHLDLSVWKGIAQAALIMNIDDLLCVGAVDNILVSSTIGRNKLLIPGEVISAIINGTARFFHFQPHPTNSTDARSDASHATRKE